MIEIFQGNDRVFILPRTDINGNMISTKPQKMWFTVKGKLDHVGFLFQKTIDNGINQRADGLWEITIDAEDTANINPGRYVCDVKVVNEYGKEYTIVKPQDFVVLPVATQIANQGV